MRTRVFHDEKRSGTYRQDDEVAVLTEGHQRLNGVLRELSGSFGRDVSVLDLGCGTGRYFHCLQQVERLTGADISIHMLREARMPVRADRITCGRIDLVCADISRLPFAHESFDLIYSVGVFLGHLTFGRSMCDQLYDLLKVGGKIFVTLADLSAQAGRAVQTQLREVMDESRFDRHQISFFNHERTGKRYQFYGCTAFKDTRRARDERQQHPPQAGGAGAASGDIVWRSVDQAVSQILALVPSGDLFILADEDVFRTRLAIDRRVTPFTERDGHYWGPPADDASAIAELERLCRAGATFIVFAWPAFWWLDYYAGFARHLRSEFRCVLENDLLVMFDLRL